MFPFSRLLKVFALQKLIVLSCGTKPFDFPMIQPLVLTFTPPWYPNVSPSDYSLHHSLV